MELIARMIFHMEEVDLNPAPAVPPEGDVRRKFWNELLGGTKILFCGCGLKCFHP